jgi:ribosomal 30S subunit maturation factor RimM
MGSGDALRIGRVARAHGVKGELEVRLDWPDSRSLLEAKRLLLSLADGTSQSHAIAGRRQTPKGVLVRLEGVVDRNVAEAAVWGDGERLAHRPASAPRRGILPV